ncbi:MAG TPA: TetR/AcrR family transcriptional regulator [Actinomycetota bacterium]|jgi:AcrR family transcriptional regulator
MGPSARHHPAGAPSAPEQGARALDQARRPRVRKPPDQRRREILDAAIELFRERGFLATPVPAIARAAGMAAGTVYLYFPSKEAILAALQEDFEAGLLERFAEIAQAVLREEDARGDVVGYEEVVERLVDGIVDYGVARRDVCEVMAGNIGRAGIASDDRILAGGLTEVLADVIREGVRLGYIATADPEMAAYMLNLSAITSIGHAIAFADDEMLERTVRQAKELYVKALAPVDR